MPSPHLQEEAVEAAAIREANCASTWGHNGGRAWDELDESERDGYRANARENLLVALPAIEKKVRRDLQERLTGLAIGTAPDRDERYQTAWRDGVVAAKNSIFEESDHA